MRSTVTGLLRLQNENKYSSSSTFIFTVSRLFQSLQPELVCIIKSWLKYGDYS